MKKYFIIIFILFTIIIIGCQVPKSGRAGYPSPPSSTASSTPDLTPSTPPSTPSVSPTASPLPSPSVSAEHCETHMTDDPPTPDRIRRVYPGPIIKYENCPAEKPFCGSVGGAIIRGVIPYYKKGCFQCLSDYNCGSKCEEFPVCTSGFCTFCDYIIAGSCESETNDKGEITRWCEYKPEKREDLPTGVSWGACYVGSCKQTTIVGGLIPMGECTVTDADCGETCSDNKIYDLIANDKNTGCEIDRSDSSRPISCGAQPCTMSLSAGGVQTASCGCALIGKSLTIGGGSSSTGQVIPSNLKCLSGEPFGNFVGSGGLDTRLNNLIELCNKCGLSGITLNFMGHGTPGSQSICYPENPPGCDTLNVDYCKSTRGTNKLNQLRGCVNKIVFNGCEVGQGTKGKELTDCIAGKLGISTENVVASKEKNVIDPSKGGLYPISNACSSSPPPSPPPPSPSSPTPTPTPTPSTTPSPSSSA